MAIHAPITPASRAEALTCSPNCHATTGHIDPAAAANISQLLGDIALVASSTRIGPRDWADRLSCGIADVVAALSETDGVVWDARMALLLECEQMQTTVDRVQAGLKARHDAAALIADACALHIGWLARFAAEHAPPDTPTSRQRSLFQRMVHAAWGGDAGQAHPI